MLCVFAEKGEEEDLFIFNDTVAGRFCEGGGKRERTSEKRKGKEGLVGREGEKEHEGQPVHLAFH